MASEPLAGRRITKVTERKTKVDWAHFLHDIAAAYPNASLITLVIDNLGTHSPGALYEAYPPAQAKALMGPVRVRVHAEARKLAQCRRDRTERDDRSMPQAPDRLDR